MLTGQIINGLVAGSMYALVAIGFTLILGVLDKLNFAHPEVFMFGGFVGALAATAGLPFWITLIAAPVAGALLGIAVEWMCFRRFEGPEGHVTAALSSLAFGLVLVDVTQKIWGTDPVGVRAPEGFVSGGVVIAGVAITPVQLVILGVALLSTAGLQLFISRTPSGRAIRAVAESKLHSALIGIDGLRVTQLTFALSSALAALGGLFLSLRSGFATTEVGLTFGLKALAIMAIGGIGDLRGAVIVGLATGVVEALAFQYGLGQLSEVVVWAVMIVFLLVRPQGLFPSPTREARA